MRLRWGGPLLAVVIVAGCGAGAIEDADPSNAARAPVSPMIVPVASTLAPEPSTAQSMPPSSTSSASALGVLLIPFAGREMELAIVGEPGVVVAWRAATDQEITAGSWRDDDVALSRLTDRKLVLGWTGTVCDVKATLAAARDRLVISPVPRDGCDAMAVSRGVVLTYATPIEPASVVVVLEPTELLPEGS